MKRKNFIFDASILLLSLLLLPSLVGCGIATTIPIPSSTMIILFALRYLLSIIICIFLFILYKKLLSTLGHKYIYKSNIKNIPSNILLVISFVSVLITFVCNLIFIYTLNINGYGVLRTTNPVMQIWNDGVSKFTLKVYPNTWLFPTIVQFTIENESDKAIEYPDIFVRYAYYVSKPECYYTIRIYKSDQAIFAKWGEMFSTQPTKLITSRESNTWTIYLEDYYRELRKPGSYRMAFCYISDSQEQEYWNGLIKLDNIEVNRENPFLWHEVTILIGCLSLIGSGLLGIYLGRRSHISVSIGWVYIGISTLVAILLIIYAYVNISDDFIFK